MRNAFFLDFNTPARKVLMAFRAMKVIIPEYTCMIFYRELPNSSYRFRSATEFHACIACIQTSVSACNPVGRQLEGRQKGKLTLPDIKSLDPATKPIYLTV